MSSPQHPRRSGSTSPSAPSRTTTPVVVAIVVAVCIGAVVAISFLLREDSDTQGAAVDRAGSTGTPGDCGDAAQPPAEPQQFEAAPEPASVEGKRVEAVLATNCGDVTVELYGDKAPQTVASFAFLAEEGYFDDSPCHRLTTENLFVLQCGDPTGTGQGGPGYVFGIENAPADGAYPSGTLAMARTSDPNSNGSQFFIVYEDTQLPDPNGYSVFGEVTDGMDVVDFVAEQGVAGGAGDGAPAQPLSILDVTVTDE
ncbi:MAG: peptidylprolyl isomerase [Nocardioidaceae bacterium]|nr:peptidylprolyl isomerase [Nocardioidaceae bacterium]